MARPPLESDSPLQSDVPGGTPEEPAKKQGAASFFKELPVLILIAFGLALLIKTFLVQAFYIPSESMVPTLEVGDRVLVNKLIYRFRDPRRGEVIVFVGEREPGEAQRSFFGKVRDFLTEGLGASQPAHRDFIKRIIGLPGETVEMRDGVVTITTVDRKTLKLSEPYLAEDKDLSQFGPTTVPPDSYFVMGDNRTMSSDSRSTLGSIRRGDVVGKAFVKVWPLGRLGIMRTPKYDKPAAAAILFVPALLAARRRQRARSALGAGRKAA